MGLVTICKYRRTKNPYVVEGLGIHIYSMEELSWFLYHNICLVDRKLFDERLCLWLENEIGCPELSERIRSGMRSGTSFQNLVVSVAGAADLFSGRELNEMGERLKSLSSLQEQERLKMRADELLDARNEFAAMEEYRHILRMHQNNRLGMAFYGAVWHNLGVACARQFLFAEAAECFRSANEYCPDEESEAAEELAGSLAEGRRKTGMRPEEYLNPQKKLLEWEQEYRNRQK